MSVRDFLAACLGCFVLSLCGVASAQEQRGTHMYVAWSPDGKALAYSAYLSGRPVIYLAPLDELRGHLIEVLPAAANDPQWTSDGSGILFTAPVQGQRDLHLYDLASGQIRQLSQTETSESAAVRSPTGDRVAYTAAHDGHRAIWLANGPDGAGARVLVASDHLDFFNPSWAPDGDRLAFFAEAGDHHDQIWVADADGQNLRRITDGTGHNTFPSWAPDGKSLLYTRSSGDADTPGGVLVSHAFGEAPKVIGGEDKVFLGVWSPDGSRIALTRFGDDTDAPLRTDLVIIAPDGRETGLIRP